VGLFRDMLGIFYDYYYYYFECKFLNIQSVEYELH